MLLANLFRPLVPRRARWFGLVGLAALLALASACQSTVPPEAPAVDHRLPKPAGAAVRFSLIKTGQTQTRDALTWDGGSWWKKVTVNHTAVLVAHPSGRLLIDSGLGARTDEHFDGEMPWWLKPLMRYEGLQPARAQLDARGEAPVPRIVLTHGHWDHVSGLLDFPEAEVWITEREREFVRTARPPAVLPSQVSSPDIRWHTYALEARRWGPFEQHLDLFGDGSVVLVPLYGHTPGSVGVVVTLPSGRQAMFVGDVAWRAEAVAHEAPKPFLSRRVVDHDAQATHQTVRLLNAIQKANPGLLIIPAHDAAVHDALGHYPAWVE